MKRIVFMLTLLLHLLSGQGLSAQTKDSVNGSVVDKYGEPLIGASIVDKSGKYALTDNDGNFTLSGINFPATVTVSFIGFDDKVFTINGTEASPITLTMDTENTMLEETVVVGYGTQKKVNLTGAVSVIDGKDLNARPVTNTAMAIQGADPSLVLTQGSGSLDGGSYSFNIRGKLSLNSGSPLVLVDGVEGTLAQVNPNDIESVSVLKDASACAIYGTKASAGVILITTKSGQSGEAKITYNGRYSISQNTTSTDFITDGYDYVTLCNDFYSVNKGHNAFTYSDEQMEMLRERHGDVTENPARAWVIPDDTGVNTYVYLANYDWYSFLFKRTRPETEHNVTVRGGSDKVKYYASVRYLYREGVFNGNASDALNNISLRGKVDAKMTSWLDFSTNVSLLRSNYKWGGYMEMDGSTDLNSQGIMWNLTQNVSPTYVPFNPDGTVVMVPDFMADATSPLMSGRAGAFLSNVNHNENKNNYWTWTNRLTAHIAKWLDFNVDYSYRRRDRQSTNRMNPTPNSYDNHNKRMYVGNGLSGGYFSNGSIYDYFREYNYYQDGNVANAWFNFHNTFGKNHNVSATLGANFDDYYSRSVTLEQKGSLSDKLSYINLTDGEIQKAIDAVSAYRTLGFFGRLNYDFAGRYLFEVSGRYDGSSRFPEGQRWAFFPSFSAGWRVSEEPFWAPIKPVVSNFKIRASYGTLGNQQVDNYYYWDTISTGTLGGYTFDGLAKAGYANASSPKSSNLTWETVVSKNLGLDLGFLRNRLTITADFFIRDTKNMLTKAMTLPDVYGETAPKENAADLQTRGYEIALSWKDNFKLAGKPFYYGVSASLGDFRTWITRFDNPDKLLSDNYVGKELGEIWGYTTDGLFATDEEAAEYEATYNSSIVNKGIFDAVAPYNHLMAGDIKYHNLDDDPAINTATNTLDDPGDRAVIGNSRPRYNYSFKGDLSWAGLDISVFFQGVGKMDWMPSSYCSYFWGPYAYQRPTFIPKNFRDNCWSAEPGADNSKAFFPRQRGLIAGSSNLVTSDYWLQNAAYLRLKNLTIGYTLPLPKNKVLEKARIYFSGENLFYWSPLKKVTKYVDPEVATNSATRDIMYPYSKTFSFGVDITF